MGRVSELRSGYARAAEGGKLMYDELINLLRRCGKQKCKNCEYEHVLGCVTKMNEKAADAIEELQKQRDEWERS